jgi:Uma2 family endonuclease
MPIPVTEAPYRPVPLDPPRKHWTRAECAALEASGLLTPQDLELVEGELITKMGKKRPHVNGVTFVMAWLVRIFGQEFVNTEAPIDVAPEDNPTNEPAPDIIVLTRPSWEFANANPQPSDLHLLVEISDTTLGFDLTTKAALYARARVAEYWVLDLAARRLVVHRDPQAGRYATIAAYSESESVAPLAAPQSAFRVADAFPPSTI